MPPEASDKMNRRLNRPGIAVLLLALGLRSVIAVGLDAKPIQDFWSYLARAQNLRVHGTYGPFPGMSDAAYPPAYPLLLSGIIGVGSDPAQAGRWLNVALGGVTVLLTGILAGLLGGQRVALLALILAATAPRALLQTAVLASENLFSPLLLLLLLLAAGPRQGEGGMGRAAAAGFVCGLLALTRAVGYGLFLVWPLAGWGCGRGWRKIARETALVLLVQHLVLMPWAVRNAISLGAPRLLTTTGGINLFIGNHEGATGGWVPWQEALRREVSGVDALPPPAVDEAAGRAARRWIAANPGRALALYARKLGTMLFEGDEYVLFYSVTGRGGAPLPRVVDVLEEGHPARRHATSLRWALDGWLVVLVLLVCVGMTGSPGVARPGSPPGVARLVLMTAAYFPLSAAVFLASTRFRWPAVDLLVVLAAVGLDRLLSRPSPGQTSGRSRGQIG